MGQIPRYIAPFFRYVAYRFIEGRGARNHFRVLLRKFKMFIDFKSGALENLATYEIGIKHWQRRISFWLSFQEKVDIQEIKLNGRSHQAYRLYSVILPFFDYRVNYLVINRLRKDSGDSKIRISIRYRIVMSNSRSDLCTMLENSVFSDEFHLYNLWFPVLASRISLQEVLSGELPEAQGSPYELHIQLSEPGDVRGEGNVSKLTPTEYVVDHQRRTAKYPFVCGGKLKHVSYYLDDLRVNFYYRHALSGQESAIKNLTDTLFKGIRHIVKMLDNFDEQEINLYCLPIIAGGYGLLHSILINEDYVVILAKYGNLRASSRLVWHEFIHYWWENRISSVGPGKYLLTEGMTVLFEWLTTRDIFGEDFLNFILQFAKEEVLEIRGFEKTIAYANRVPPFGNVVIYKKAPLVLYQLLKMTGEEKFIGYCRAFLKEPGAYRWQDFLRGLEGYCGIDLAEYDSQWVYRRELTDGADKGHIILSDGRPQQERNFDYHIAQWIKNGNDRKFCEQLKQITPIEKIWNKYYYYACLCAKQEGNLMKALEYCERMDEQRDLRYCLRGLFLKAQLEKQEGSIEAAMTTLDRILTCRYPIDEALELRQVFGEYKELRGSGVYH